MQRSKLRNLYLEVRSDENKPGIRSKEIFVSHYLEKLKKPRYEDLSIADVTVNKKFWKRVEPLLGNKIKVNLNIVLVENNYLITDEKSLAETFKDDFANVVSDLGVSILDDNSGKGDVSNSNHPRIITIKQNNGQKQSFFF